MQKLNIKQLLVKSLLVLFIFALTGYEVGQAAGSKNSGESCTQDDDCESGDCREGKCAAMFEVTLQTPFSKPPDQWETPEICTKTDKAVYKKDPNNPDYEWVCLPDSEKWHQVVTGDDGGEILTNFSAMLYRWLAGFIGLVSVLMMVVGGIQMSTAGASQEGFQDGKDRIIAALVGLLLLFLSSLILYTINPTFFEFEAGICQDKNKKWYKDGEETDCTKLDSSYATGPKATCSAEKNDWDVSACK